MNSVSKIQSPQHYNYINLLYMMTTDLKSIKLSQNFSTSNEYQRFNLTKTMLSKFSEKRDFSILKKSCVSQEISSKAESIIKEVGNKVVQKDKINFDGRDQIERLFLEIKSIQEEKNSIIEEIEFFLLNFQYIIELFEENMTKNLSEKMNAILGQKNKIISSLNQRIKFFQKTESKLEQTEKQNVKFEETINQLNSKVFDLEIKNRQLKEKLSERQNNFSFKSINFPDIELQTSRVNKGDLILLPQMKKLEKNLFYSERVERQYPPAAKSSSNLLSYKRKDSGLSEQIQNIGKIKAKIMRLKSELLVTNN